MNFGLLMSFRNSSRNELSYSDLYRKHVDLAVEAEEMGYDTIWLTEHHFVEDGYSPSMVPLAAAIATRTKKIRIGTFVLLMPLYHPLHVAEDAATLDACPTAASISGSARVTYRASSPASISCVRNAACGCAKASRSCGACFTEDNVTFEGKHYTVRDVTLYPKAVQQPHPPIWIGARSRPATERAARNGYHLAGTGAAQAEVYRGALRTAGRNPDDFNIAQLRFGYVASEARQGVGRMRVRDASSAERNTVSGSARPTTFPATRITRRFRRWGNSARPATRA
jgi:alkanesulfonate monooxygenase SsuD/methylene tetrahydromethanopterin reductase-like flavin-dependent oxidoreductase (luciferase family)